MSRNRMEAFSDGVLAIIITVMVLKLNPPSNFDFSSIKEVLPTLVAYILSYVYIGIYWTNHHHLLHTVGSVSGNILWKNLHWLFWMSLIPTATEWMGLNPTEKIPTLFYGIILFMCAISYHILQRAIVKKSGKNSLLAQSIGKDYKGKFSIFAYGLAIIMAMIWPFIAQLLFFATATLWIVPDMRVEGILTDDRNVNNRQE